MSDIHVKGLADLQAFLDKLPAKMESNVMRGAMGAAAKPMKISAQERCPVGVPSSTGAKRYGLHTGSLRDSIRVSTKVKNGKVTASIKAGGKTKKAGDVWYAHIVEYTGARAHTITAKNRKGLSFGGLFFQSADHPGMRAKPFMRPALHTQAGNSVLAAGEYIKKRLATKEGLNTAHIELELE